LKKKSTGGVREHSPLAKTVASAKKDAVIWAGGVISFSPFPRQNFLSDYQERMENGGEKCLKRNCSECLQDGQLIARKKYN